MNRYIYGLAAIAMSVLPSCSDDEKLPNVTPVDRGVVTDDLGNDYEWVRIGDQMWTTANANNGADMADHEYFNNFNYVYVFSSDNDIEYLEEKYHPQYGNLMSLDEAIKSAPEGWRVPTDEDWQKLEKYLGMSNTGSTGWRGNNGVGFEMKKSGEGCELGLLLAGSCGWKANFGSMEQKLKWVEEYGYYWTSTIEPAYEEAEHEMAYFRKIASCSDGVERQCGRTDNLFSVRWVRDAK